MPEADLVLQLQQLAQLHAAGVLDDADFTAAKERLLADDVGDAIGSAPVDVDEPPLEAPAEAAEPTPVTDGPMFGPYRLEQLIGRGGMGEVYRAYDTVRGRIVALKRLPVPLAADPTFQARFRAEAALAARLHEPHVIPIHDYGEVDGQLYIDMRLVNGPDLATLLGRDGPLSPQRAVDIVTQIASALDAAHAAGLVHRDIKPGNILVVDADAGNPAAVAARAADFVYVADFGIARATDSGNSGSLTATGTTVGSLDYVAPERFGTGHGDYRADIYALGCLLHEALTGQRPFPVQGLPAIINAHLNTPPPAPTGLCPDVPAGLDAVVACAMAKDPDQRYASAGALAAAAHDALVGVGSAIDSRETTAAPLVAAAPGSIRGAATSNAASASPLRSGPGGGAGSSRRRRLVILAAVATVVVLVAAVVTSQLLKPGPDNNQIVAEPFTGGGANPFMPSITAGTPASVTPVRTGGTVSGSTAGLYGGTLNNASCDQGQMVSFLQANPDKGEAWAQVEGISSADIPSFVAGLTPVVLRADVAVTNHGFADGAATTIHSILQAGTAVLVDRYGVPRARCACGNPLTPPTALSAPAYSGERWSGFNPSSVVTIAPSPLPLDELILVDPVSQLVFTRPIGSAGPSDKPEPTTPTSAPVPTIDAPPNITQTVVPQPQAPAQPPVEIPPPPAPQRPPAPEPPPVVQTSEPVQTPPPPTEHSPVITEHSSYTEGVIVYMSLSYSDADGNAQGFGFVGVNGAGWAQETHPFSSPSYGRVSPGRVDYPFNLACGQSNQYTSDVKAWIYDSTGRQSKAIIAHLTCS